LAETPLVLGGGNPERFTAGEPRFPVLGHREWRLGLLRLRSGVQPNEAAELRARRRLVLRLEVEALLNGHAVDLYREPRAPAALRPVERTRARPAPFAFSHRLAPSRACRTPRRKRGMPTRVSPLR